MGSLRRKKDTPFWFACFTGPDGRRVQRSTGQRDRQKASAVAKEYELSARLARENRFGLEQARRVIANIFEATNAEPLPTATTRDFLLNWPEKRKNDISHRTYQAYSQVARDFIESLGNRADRDINQISRQDIIKFRDSVALRSSAATANKLLKYLRVGLREAWKADLISENPAEKVDLLSRREQDRPTRRAFTLQEVQSLLDVANAEWQGLILFGFYTGQRLADLGSLCWKNVDLRERSLKFITRKTGRAMEIPLAYPLLRFIEAMPRNNSLSTTPLFPTAYPIATRLTGDSRLSQQFNELLVKVGLASERSKAETGLGRRRRRAVNAVSFHSFRHTATTLIKQGGASLPVAMDIIGHDSKAVSTAYTHLDLETQRHAVDKLPDVTAAIKTVPALRNG